MTTTPNTEHLREFITQARKNRSLLRFTPLIDAFETCLNASVEQRENPYNPNLRQAAQEKYSLFHKELVSACYDTGTSLPTLTAYIENPANFTLQEWKEISDLQANRSSPSPKARKLRKNTKKMRI